MKYELLSTFLACTIIDAASRRLFPGTRKKSKTGWSPEEHASGSKGAYLHPLQQLVLKNRVEPVFPTDPRPEPAADFERRGPGCGARWFHGAYVQRIAHNRAVSSLHSAVKQRIGIARE